ncbi:MAG: hypothetical protein VX434_00755 [Pseudomonadota bacterium]|nr:hypothetical protein [Pseudomonadota bacterium]
MRLIKFGLCVGLFSILVANSYGTTADAKGLKEFYKGKTLSVMIGYGAGGGYDMYSRTLARYISKHIPGNPKVIGKNMPGAGSLKLANWMYSVAPKNGTVFATIARGAPVHSLLGGKGARFDATKFNWLGSMNNEVSVCATTFRAPAKTFKELKSKETIIGGGGKTSDNEVFAMFAQNLLGAKFKLISGYPGMKVMFLAMQRGEIDGVCGWSWTGVKKQKVAVEWYKAKKLNVLLQFALQKHPELPNVPLITDLAKNASEKAQMELIFSRQTMGRPYLMPPGVNSERVEMMRKAFIATMKDPEFNAFAKKTKMEVNYVSGSDVQKLVNRVLNTPKATVQAAIINTRHKGKVEKVKLNYVKASGTVTAVKRKGRKLVLKIGSKKVKTKVSGKRTKVFVNGTKVKRGAVKPGMRCELTWLGNGTESKKVDCKL